MKVNAGIDQELKYSLSVNQDSLNINIKDNPNVSTTIQSGESFL